jgi:hypothetical protein
MVRCRSLLLVSILLLAACGENAPPKAPVATVTETSAASSVATTTTSSATTAAKPQLVVETSASNPTEHAHERVIAQVRAADRAVAYRISPKGLHLKAGDVFTVEAGSYLRIGDGAYPVRSQAISLSTAQFSAVREHVLALDAKGTETQTLMCLFSPGVAICFDQRIKLNEGVVHPEERWERTAVLLICYGCQEVALVTSAGDRPWWKRYFYADPEPQAALFSLAKALFPADPDIQRMAPKSAKNLAEDDDDE